MRNVIGMWVLLNGSCLLLVFLRNVVFSASPIRVDPLDMRCPHLIEEVLDAPGDLLAVFGKINLVGWRKVVVWKF